MGMPGVKTDIYYVLRDTHSLVNATQGFLIDRCMGPWIHTHGGVNLLTWIENFRCTYGGVNVRTWLMM